MPAKPKTYTVEVVVRVWRNLKMWGKIPTSHFGHASVEVLSKFVPGFYQHVSFWPGDYASKGNAIKKQSSSSTATPKTDKISEMNRLTALRLEVGYCKQNGIAYPAEWDDVLRETNKGPINTPRPGQKRTGELDDDDLPMWSQSPDVKTYLPGFGAQGRNWGLSTGRMGKQNCAGVALMALEAGGAGAIVKLPKVTIYGEPVQVEDYAESVLAQLNQMESWTDDLEQDIKQAVISGKVKPAPSDNLVDGLWTLDTWKQKSALGGMTVRSANIREIDDAVEKYHQGDWNDGYLKRYKALVNMFVALCKHRQEKPDSKRSEGLLRLGAQILAIVHNPGPIW
jgi:hypothetical protein